MSAVLPAFVRITESVTVPSIFFFRSLSSYAAAVRWIERANPPRWLWHNRSPSWVPSPNCPGRVGPRGAPEQLSARWPRRTGAFVAYNQSCEMWVVYTFPQRLKPVFKTSPLSQRRSAAPPKSKSEGGKPLPPKSKDKVKFFGKLVKAALSKQIQTDAQNRFRLTHYETVAPAWVWADAGMLRPSTAAICLTCCISASNWSG